MNSMPRVFLLTSDVQDWCLRPAEYFYRKYWPSADILVAGFRRPPFDTSFLFHSIGDMRDYPYQKWSNALIDFLNSVPDEIFIYSMEDFWPVRYVDEQAITSLSNFMLFNPQISRIDLTSDREYAGNAIDVQSLGRLDIITNPLETPYMLSLQCGLWRKSEMLKYLTPNETPHQVEMLGTERMIKGQAIVYGTRQNPVRVLIAVQNGKIAIDNSYQVPRPVVDPHDMSVISQWLP